MRIHQPTFLHQIPKNFIDYFSVLKEEQSDIGDDGVEGHYESDLRYDSFVEVKGGVIGSDLCDDDKDTRVQKLKNSHFYHQNCLILSFSLVSLLLCEVAQRQH